MLRPYHSQAGHRFVIGKDENKGLHMGHVLRLNRKTRCVESKQDSTNQWIDDATEVEFCDCAHDYRRPPIFRSLSRKEIERPRCAWSLFNLSNDNSIGRKGAQQGKGRLSGSHSSLTWWSRAPVIDRSMLILHRLKRAHKCGFWAKSCCSKWGVAIDV
jgi:hypothetical protein